jgi:hypothetical protein
MARFPQHTASKTHADLLRSCSDALAERSHEINSMVIDDLLDAGYCVTLDPRGSLSGGPSAQIVHREVKINLASGIGEDPWDALAHVLRWGSERATELNV